MAVYVDQPLHKFGRMVMCHMLADSELELHEMAEKIGLRRDWFQNEKTPHYDICKAKRKRAIQLGAREISRRETVAIIRRLRVSNMEFANAR